MSLEQLEIQVQKPPTDHYCMYLLLFFLFSCLLKREKIMNYEQEMARSRHICGAGGSKGEAHIGEG